ncbi:putative structural molecule [Hibiscus syriacus]|uniref:Structural molecule n=1 Tax=Hibiscus syriacus TaxID=106335 RepID=A0A6A2WQN6_HIBSY|nr:putative structural molecule [Hibiscus syriacus]
MSYLSRVWMATSVAVVQGRGENQGQNWKSGIKFLQQGQRRLFDGESSDLRHISGRIGSDLSGMIGNREGQADESICRVMQEAVICMRQLKLIDVRDPSWRLNEVPNNTECIQAN